MLSRDLARYIDQKRSLGFKFRSQAVQLRSFVAFAEERGDRYVRSARVLGWSSHSPIATQALARIKELYTVEDEIRGLPFELRQRARQDRSRAIVAALKPWFEQSLAAVPKGGKIGEALAYALNHWHGLTRFLDDGCIEIDSNAVERSIRGLALNRKNALFAGHDLGAENWATIASLVETCKLNAVDPLAWMLTKLVNLWPASRIDDLMPWAYAARPS